MEWYQTCATPDCGKPSGNQKYCDVCLPSIAEFYRIVLTKPTAKQMAQRIANQMDAVIR